MYLVKLIIGLIQRQNLITLDFLCDHRCTTAIATVRITSATTRTLAFGGQSVGYTYYIVTVGMLIK